MSVAAYYEKVIEPLTIFQRERFDTVVLWFGEDVFCQMNLLAMLAYIEQLAFEGTVYLHSFREDEFKVSQTKLELGPYKALYEQVLVDHRKPEHVPLPVMHQAIEWYFHLLEEPNELTRFIQQNAGLPKEELLKQLFRAFEVIGYGDRQYEALMERYYTK